jgi:hypothetical protein
LAVNGPPEPSTLNDRPPSFALVVSRWIVAGALALAACDADDIKVARSDMSALPVDAAHSDDLAPPSDLAAADLTPPADLAPAPDLAAPPDMATGGQCVMHDPAGATCNQLGQWILEWVDCHLSCSTDKECTVISVHQGCKNPCPVVVNTSADGQYRQSLDAAYVATGCGVGGCACVAPPTPVCKNHVCVRM